MPFVAIIIPLVSIAVSALILYQAVLAAVRKAIRLSRYDNFILCPNCHTEVVEGKECPKCGKRYSRYVEMPTRE
jgi:rRNA maturation endonuclease Nob1